MAKSDKLYNKSPSIKKDGDGKAKLDKPSKAMMDHTGLEGNPLPPDGADEMPVHVKQYADMHDRHISEKKSMHDRHAVEMKDMHDRHHKEHKKFAADHSGTDASGESLINKTEGTM